MKKSLCIIFIMSFIAGSVKLFAQESSDTTKVLLPDKIVLTGFGAPYVEFSSVENQFAVCLGGGAAFMVNHAFFLGGYFEGIMTKHYREDLKTFVNIEEPKIAFAHGGIWTGYVIKHKKPVHGGVSLKLGWGEINLEGDGYDYNPDLDYDFKDRIFTVIPQVELELNMTQWFRINIGAGYRFVTGIDAEYLDVKGNPAQFYDKRDYNSPVGTITLLFGGKEKAR